MSEPLDYDAVAPDYDRRYETNRFEGIHSCLQRFLGTQPRAIAEVGCGTGHWLAAVDDDPSCLVVGIDRSLGMLQRAAATAPRALLLQGSAEHLPLGTATLDRVFCVNAFHHFGGPRSFLSECRRVLRPNGELLTIGLDPHNGTDRWWIYDYFPSALDLDLKRYPSVNTMRSWAREAGFRETTVSVAQHIPATVPFERALAQGLIERTATSQLMVIADEEYAAGRTRLMAERPVLRADLRLYASVARIQAH